MEITRQKSGDLLVIRLAGRLDADWCDSVEDALGTAVREGEHRIHLDMEKVDYISSAGLRVLFGLYKQLMGIGGVCGIVNPHPRVRSVLELSGLASLISSGQAAAAPTPEEHGKVITTEKATCEIFPLGGKGFSLAGSGDPGALREGRISTIPSTQRFDKNTIAVGVGALGASYEDCRPRFGEFLAVGGTAVYQPSDGSSRPDFVTMQQALVPEGCLLTGLSGTGDFSTLVRFEVKKEFPAVGLTELARMVLDLAGTEAAVIGGVTETAGLVGAALRKSPALPNGAGDHFGFPQIRDWLSFTSERAYRDSTSFVTGVVAREGGGFASWLRPIGAGLLGHFHAASFSYGPLPKGHIELGTTVNNLFESSGLQAVLHLLTDLREFNGAGESEFLRGALWIAPVLSTP